MSDAGRVLFPFFILQDYPFVFLEGPGANRSSLRATTRPVIPPTNLKERIAALEQRNTLYGGTTTRPTSPTPSVASSIGGNAPSTGAFRDKIAKFERKGGVPVPRGSFGLGAPPTVGGPRRQGELYGNRIPAPARAVSASMAGSIASMSRAPSPMGMSELGSPGASPNDNRRSFSLSSVSSDFDDHVDYTPVTSPTFAFPPDSPESLASLSYTPEASPSSLSTAGDAAAFKHNIIRGTSFQKALEIARTAEQAKVESGVAGQYALFEGDGVEDPTTPTTRQLFHDNAVEPLVHEPTPENQVPTIISESPVEAPITLPPATHDPEAESAPQAEPMSSVIVEEITPTAIHEPPIESPTPALTHASPVTNITPALIDKSAVINTTPSLPNKSPLEDPTPAPDESSIPVKPLTNVDVHDSSIEEASRPLRPITPPSHNPPAAASTVQPVLHVAAPRPMTPVVPIAPLAIRKRTSPQPVSTPTPPAPSPPVPAAPVVVVEPDIQVPMEPLVLRESVFKPIGEITMESGQVGLPSVPEILVGRSPQDQKEVKRAPKHVGSSTPEIIVHEEPTPTSHVLGTSQVEEASRHAERAARKSALTLDADRIAQDSSVSPPAATGNTSAYSLTDVFSNYFTGGGKATGAFRSTTPPPVPKHMPDSPLATLAYDADTSPPPARPRVKAPDPSSFLSPPATGFMSAVPSSGGSSMGSYSSMGSRPMSMIETSPGHVTRALRMTPATSRGVPMFLPANSSRPRKSDFVYFPPTPDEEEMALEEAEAEFGVVTIGHRRRGSEPDLTNPRSAKPSFRAVVHGKVRETPASATMPSSRMRPLPATPQIKRIKRATILEPPLSPGQGELADLLQEAVLLEDALDKGELPSEVAKPMAERIEERKREAEERARSEAQALEEERFKEEEKQRIAYTTAQLKVKRDQPTAGRLKHTFLIPLSKARSAHSAHRKEVSTSRAETFPHKPQVENSIIRPKSAGLPDQSGANSARAELSQAGQNAKIVRPKTPDTSALPAGAPETPSKSPKPSRFASFKRLGSISRTGTASGHPTRYSNSTSSEISSEDSAAAMTPPDNNLDFGMRPLGEFGYLQGGQIQSSSTSFPSLSPKKSTSSVGRATSFAEKMWSRTRTKSNGSVLSSTSEVTDRGPPPAINLPPLPSIPSLQPSSPERDGARILNPPSRSTSLKHPMQLPPVPTTAPPLPTATPSAVYPQTPTQSSENDSLLIPASNDSTRPSSWTSVSSAGSLPSPLFDKALFDAFPSVPGAVPAPATTLVHSFPHRRDISLTAAATTATRADFDSALLSSAIHLASSHKGAPASAAPASGLSSRAMTPTIGRRSGEAAR